MFEAKLASAGIIKKILEAIKDLLTDAQWDCRDSGLSLQAMDSSHVALVALKLNADGFEDYRCDRSMSLGLNITNMTKIMKAANADDSFMIRAQDNSDTVIFVFEAPSADRFSQYSLKLMDLDTEHLGIPDTQYNCTVTLPSAEFSRICRDLLSIGESITIECNKVGIKFTTKGDLGSGTILLQQTDVEGKEVKIDMREPCKVTFATKYLNNFSKAAPLSPSVQLSLSDDMPISVEFTIESIGYIRYYLAPKIEEDTEYAAEGQEEGDEEATMED
uniref:DNA sliding clamp PCNA n=1 Tax=Trichuris muris TaxID=70415 RepID=A0A5S6R3S1_TRIMR